MMNIDLSGKVAIVTGSSQGIGRAAVEVLVKAGAKVVMNKHNNEEILKSVAIEISDEFGGTVVPVLADVTKKEEAQRLIDAALELGGIDILVNNAGISIPAPIDSDGYPAAWDKSLAVLLTAHTHTIRAALPHLRQAEHARIVNIASTEALGATRYGSPYTAAKTAVIGLTRSLAVELGPEAITVNCICPGPIRTGMTAAIPEDNKKEFARRRVALKRYAEPEEVAHGTLNFCLPASSFMTGTHLPVDGGLTIKNA